MRTLLCGVLLSALLAGCQTQVEVKDRGSVHTKAGQIIKDSTGELISREQLVQELSQAPIVLLGEKHDNLEHHELQLWLVQAMEQRRKQGALVFEMLTTEQQALIEQVKQRIEQKQPPKDLATALDWSPGWDWAQYKALVEHAFTSDVQVVAGNLSRSELMSIYRNPVRIEQGMAGAAQVREQLHQHIFEAHCQKLPESQVPAMLAVQQQRDRHMAQMLLQSEKPTVLVAGAYHARKDLGVPLHLMDLQGADSQVLLFVEQGQPYEKGIADYVWITTAAPEKDYCAELAQ